MKTLLTFLLVSFLTFTLAAQGNEDFIMAAFKGDLDAVKKSVEGGTNVNFKNDKGQTAISVCYMHPAITEYLIGKGADVNSGDSPALVGAARSYALDVMKLLIKAGADPNKPAVVNVDVSAPVRKMLEDEKAK